jgi:hypothetical protein
MNEARILFLLWTCNESNPSCEGRYWYGTSWEGILQGLSNATCERLIKCKKVSECDGLSITLVCELGKEKEYKNYNVNISISTIKI